MLNYNRGRSSRSLNWLYPRNNKFCTLSLHKLKELLIINLSQSPLICDVGFLGENENKSVRAEPSKILQSTKNPYNSQRLVSDWKYHFCNWLTFIIDKTINPIYLRLCFYILCMVLKISCMDKTKSSWTNVVWNIMCIK